jgi:riboflavin synthase
MFTGIIQHVGSIESLERTSDGARLHVHAGPVAAGLTVSSSVAVNGCCLTVVELAGETFAADLSGETLRRTSLGELKPGAGVNLERPLSAGKELGGHFVQGHVDGVGRVARLTPDGCGLYLQPAPNKVPSWWLGVRVPAEISRYIAMKGSIAIDGISLTVAGINGGIVEAAIIPFTYANTNLQSLAPGDAVNLETDILAKYVERLLDSSRAPATSKLSLTRLIEDGF